MNASTGTDPNESAGSFLGRPGVRRAIKWTVYGLLIVHWIKYVRIDLEVAALVLREGGPWLVWAGAFASAFDASAWLLLLFALELETYVLSDEVLDGFVGYLLGALRIVCYVFLAHTVYAYGAEAYDLHRATKVEGVTNVCELVGQDLSFTRNLVYTAIEQENCADLSGASEFFVFDLGTTISDQDGLTVAIELIWADLVEAIAWLLIVFNIEFVVQLQERRIHTGPLIAASNSAKVVFYGALLLVAAYWAYRNQWFFVWDEFVWIAGFAAIEMNVAEWREELHQADL